MIPKFPEIDYPFNDEQIKVITEAVFISQQPKSPCDTLFIFGGTHPGLWETAGRLYHHNMSKCIICTGGLKPNRVVHPSWKDGNTSESHVIRRELVNIGVPFDRIIIEDKSKNSLENVNNSLPLIMKIGASSIILICKSYAAGRQYRTMARHASSFVIFLETFDTTIDENGVINATTWFHKKHWQSLILGEYFRILKYGQKGDIINDLIPVKGLDSYYLRYGINLI
jgi:hypothetical protein